MLLSTMQIGKGDMCCFKNMKHKPIAFGLLTMVFVFMVNLNCALSFGNLLVIRFPQRSWQR